MTDIEMFSVWEAARQATEYGNNKPLIDYVESGNPLVLEDKRVRKLIAKLMRGESLLGKGEKAFTKATKERRNEKIFISICLLDGYGIPINSKKKNGEPDAVTIVGERFSLSPETVWKIWNKRGADRGTWIMFRNIGEEEKNSGNKIEDLMPTAYQISMFRFAFV